MLPTPTPLSWLSIRIPRPGRSSFFPMPNERYRELVIASTPTRTRLASVLVR